MFIVSGSVYRGFGATKAQALAGMCQGQMEQYGPPEKPRKVDVIEFHPEDYFSIQSNHLDNVEEWAEDTWEVEISPDAFKRFADLFDELEREGSIIENEQDWRIDYGDEDITYVIRSEDGCVVGINEHWDQAKSSLEEVNNWEDGKTYWIDEVEGDVSDTLTLSEVNG